MARYMVQGKSCWHSSGLGKSFREFKWPATGSKNEAVGLPVTLESRFGIQGTAMRFPKEVVGWQHQQQQRQLAGLLAGSLLACLLDCLLACSFAR